MREFIIIGHTERSYRHHPKGIGEMVQTASLQRMTGAPVVDAFDVLEGTQVPEDAVKIVCSTHSVLNWLLERGLPGPLISRLYAWDDFSYTFTHLHQQATLTVAQSLLGVDLGIEQGLDPQRVLYFPFHPIDDFKVEPHPPLAEGKVVVGVPSRLLYSKNHDFLFDAFAEVGEGALLWVKGELDPANDCEWGKGYTEELAKRLQEPGIHWDRRRLSHPEMLGLMAQFDCAAYIAGIDDPGLVITELLALGVPTLLLDGGPRPSLYSGAAMFVHHQGYDRMRQGAWPFFLPDRQDLKEKLRQLIDDRALRDQLREKAPPLAKRRFGGDISASRLPLLIEGAFHMHHQTERAAEFGTAIAALRQEDVERFFSD